ncbi:MAG: hypothetical protein B1H40_02645 [Candidatus Latescibacteria bacterium 4484_181]|nr:MAG: hypothetical protein B1H40_02645 [Candidatus Latescibacteria bacterium 4484_181]RKY69684.1 MAG: hypothetical protein DRQ02_00330 [Candidatus Latescibacterota bacterium]RKY73555.1 MAG: hypothetical protein DRQ24_02110 [Candidatus Latescibacterota bacterium]HDN67826.1 hypothetical protein [Bacillota bacterium]
MTTLGVWIAALLTLFILSFLYKDNPFYKFAEHLFVGVSAGYGVAFTYHNILIPNLYVPLFKQGDYTLIIPLILGIMMVLRLFPKVGWVSRWPLAFVVGVTAGISLITYLQSNALVQIRETLRPFNTFGNVVIAVGVLTGLTYFFFSKEHKGVFGKTAKVGIWFLMITFGASFGYTVMARISLLIGRMHFLLSDWLGLIK